MIDIALIQDSLGQFDIDIDPLTGDLLGVDGFETALAMSLFCERRANESEIPTPELRRGWWGNELDPEDSFEIGSKLWLLDQPKRLQSILNAANNYAKDGLSWLTDDEHLKGVKANAIFTDDGCTINIELERDSSSTETRSFKLWENTNAV